MWGAGNLVRSKCIVITDNYPSPERRKRHFNAGSIEVYQERGAIVFNDKIDLHVIFSQSMLGIACVDDMDENVSYHFS